MKTRILILLFCFTLSSCSFFFNPNITVVDEFKNTKKTTFEITASPTGFLSPVTNANITFEHITKASGEDVNVYFVMSRSSSSFKLDKKCFVKANGAMYELEIHKAETEYKTAIKTGSTSTTVKDSTKVKTELKTKTTSYDWFDDKFVLRITPEMKNSIMKTDELVFRFYLGPNDGTFIFKGYALKRIQKLIAI
jgi:hypothetical protein